MIPKRMKEGYIYPYPRLKPGQGLIVIFLYSKEKKHVDVIALNNTSSHEHFTEL